MSFGVCCQVMSTFVKQTNYFAFGVRVKNAINSFESHPGWKVTGAAIEQVGWIFFLNFTTVGPCNIMYMNSRTFSNLGGREDTVWVNNFISERRNVVWKALLRDLASSSALMVLWLSNYQCLVGFIKRQCNYIVVLKKMLWFTWVGSCRSLMLKFVFSQTRAIWCQYRGRS